MQKPQNIGQWDRRIIIQANAQTVDADGLPQDDWANLYTNVPASQLINQGTEKQENGKLTTMQTNVFSCRYVSGITAKHRIVEGSLTYQINSVQEVGRRQALRIEATFIEGI
jgi:head-tail adaptor